MDKVDKKVAQKFSLSRIPFSRKTAVFRTKWQIVTKNPAIGFKPRASVFKIIKSKFTPVSGKNESNREYFEGKERSNSVCLIPKREVYKQSFFGEQERWRSQTNNKPYKFEQVSAIPSFKDRRSKRSKGLVATERLHVQNRLEGCLLLYSTSQKLPEV